MRHAGQSTTLTMSSMSPALSRISLRHCSYTSFGTDEISPYLLEKWADSGRFLGIAPRRVCLQRHCIGSGWSARDSVMDAASPVTISRSAMRNWFHDRAEHLKLSASSWLRTSTMIVSRAQAWVDFVNPTHRFVIRGTNKTRSIAGGRGYRLKR